MTECTRLLPATWHVPCLKSKEVCDKNASRQTCATENLDIIFAQFPLLCHDWRGTSQHLNLRYTPKTFRGILEGKNLFSCLSFLSLQLKEDGNVIPHVQKKKIGGILEGYKDSNSRDSLVYSNKGF